MATQLKSLLIDSLEDHAVSTDQYCRLLSVLGLSPEELGQIEQFLCDNERAIHSWQNYQLWLILARVKRKTERLVALAQERIKVDVLRSEVSAIFIYLRCVDEVQLLEEMASDFSSAWPYYHQRNYLLATSDSSEELLKPVVVHLGPKLKNTARRAKSYFVENLPLVDRERTPMPKMYDELNPYD